jgi:hypothetical protein
MQRGERLVVTCLACLFDPVLAAQFGWPLGTVSQWAIALVAVTTFLTAAHRVAWISARLRPARTSGEGRQAAAGEPS